MHGQCQLIVAGRTTLTEFHSPYLGDQTKIMTMKYIQEYCLSWFAKWQGYRITAQPHHRVLPASATTLLAMLEAATASTIVKPLKSEKKVVSV